MSYYTEQLYSKNSNGKVLKWHAKVDSEHCGITIYTGQLGGKIREIVNTSTERKGKNTLFEQEVKNLKAKAKLKIKNGYRTLESLGNHIATLEGHELLEALDTRLSVNKTDASGILKPMKAVQFKPNAFKYPAILQPKINGHRMVATMIKDVEGMFATNDSKVKLLTKSGHEYRLEYVVDSLPDWMFNGNVNFDGEAYVHNERLSTIKRRLSISKDGINFSKNSLPSHNVLFMIFDLSIPDMGQVDRLKLKDELLLKNRNEVYYSTYTNKYEWETINTESTVVNIRGTVINSDEEAYKHLEAAINSGFEGVVLRSIEDEYYFGGRRTNMMKLKKLLSGEFIIKDVILKSQDSTRTYITFLCKNDINDKLFEVTPEGTEANRQEFLLNSRNYVGKLLSCSYYERTITDLPFHAVGRIRGEWDLDVNDLNIEI